MLSNTKLKEWIQPLPRKRRLQWVAHIRGCKKLCLAGMTAMFPNQQLLKKWREVSCCNKQPALLAMLWCSKYLVLFSLNIHLITDLDTQLCSQSKMLDSYKLTLHKICEAAHWKSTFPLYNASSTSFMFYSRLKKWGELKGWVNPIEYICSEVEGWSKQLKSYCETGTRSIITEN